jgi:hypothetical protein
MPDQKRKTNPSTLLRLRVRAPETDEPFRTVLAGRQGAQVCSHIAQAAALRKRGPFIGRRIAEAVVAMKRVVQTTHRLSVLLDHRRRIQLCVDHDGVEGRVSEERLDDVHRHVVVQMLRGKDASAVVRQERLEDALRKGVTKLMRAYRRADLAPE